MRKPLTTLTLCLLLAATVATAEEAKKKKPLSPPATTEAKIGGKNITINYNAPSKRERVIMGELVPYGQLWRTGANSATTLTTDGDLMIGSVHVPPAATASTPSRARRSGRSSSTSRPASGAPSMTPRRTSAGRR